jgi:hypothetical protein
MTALTIVDLHEEKKLSPAEMSRVAGGDRARIKAIIEAYDVIHDVDKLLNTPDPAPAPTPMKL